MMVGRIRVILPRRRARRKGKSKWDDPYLKRMTSAVMVICLGFFLIMAGVLLTIMGTNTRTKTVKQGELEPMVVLGPLFLTLGTLASVGGGVWYGINYTNKQERDKQLERSKTTSSKKVRMANGDADSSAHTAQGQTTSSSSSSHSQQGPHKPCSDPEDEFDDIEYGVVYTTSSAQTSPMHHGVDV